VNTVLIVAPQFPPCNLAAVHRTRLFARHLPEFGWKPIVLTVEPEYYESSLDWDLMEFVPDDLRVERVPALPTEPVRLVGNIGIRSFVPMLRRIFQLERWEEIDFLYIPIPPHFSALLGRIVHALRGLPYGIDYIDPWVQEQWHPEEKPLNRHWWARKMATVLEPIAVRKASLITGVAEGYFTDMLDRNPHLNEQAVTAAMPYGGEKEDHRIVRQLDAEPYLFSTDDEAVHFVYAGSLLPNAMDPLEKVFRAIENAPEVFADVRFHFIGTGTSPDDPEGYKVRPVAERHGLWGTVVDEHPARIPYLDALVHQGAADAVFVLGSTEPHYTPSKVYQGVLAEKPVLAVLHEASSACEVIRTTHAGRVLDFGGETDLSTIETTFADEMRSFRRFAATFSSDQVDNTAFERYSARSVTQTLSEGLTSALQSR
jgi:glycosyltransferase involved in cell wall biosynthesis